MNVGRNNARTTTRFVPAATILLASLLAAHVRAETIISVDLRETQMVDGEPEEVIVATIALLRDITKLDSGSYVFRYQFHAAYGGQAGYALAIPIVPGIYVAEFPGGQFFLVDQGGQLAEWYGPNIYGGLTGFPCPDAE